MFHCSFYFFSSMKKKMSCTKIRIKKRISYDATHNSHRNVIDLFMLVEGNVLAYFCPIFPFGEVLCSYQLYVLECCTIEHTITNEKLFFFIILKMSLALELMRATQTMWHTQPFWLNSRVRLTTSVSTILLFCISSSRNFMRLCVSHSFALLAS